MIRDKKEIKQLQELLMEKDAQLNAIKDQDQKKEDERTNLLDKLDKLQNFILHSRPNLTEETVAKVKELPKRRMSWHPSLLQKRRSSLGFALKPIVLDDDDFRRRLEEMEARQPQSQPVVAASIKSPLSKSAEDIQQELHEEKFESTVSPTVRAMNLEALPQRITERRKGRSNDRRVRFTVFESPLTMIGEDDGCAPASHVADHVAHATETPRTVLRERLRRKEEHIQRLSQEYQELQEFTRLESQLNHGSPKAVSGLPPNIQLEVDDALRHAHLVRKDCELLQSELQKERDEFAALASREEVKDLAFRIVQLEREKKQISEMKDAEIASRETTAKELELKIAQLETEVKLSQQKDAELANREAAAKDLELRIAQLETEKKQLSKMKDTEFAGKEDTAKEYELKISQMEAEVKLSELKDAELASSKEVAKGLELRVAQLEAETKHLSEMNYSEPSNREDTVMGFELKVAQLEAEKTKLSEQRAAELASSEEAAKEQQTRCRAKIYIY
jgi:predicted FMN-binding regulatory protein PaiB